MTQIVETDLLLPQPQGPKPDALATIIERAAFLPDYDVEKLKALLEMKERYDREEARKAFVVALGEFKANPPKIEKTKPVTYEKGANAKPAFFYAPLDEVCKIITESLSKHQLTHRWEIEQHDATISVSCVLTHELGHSERTTLRGNSDTSGGKNGIQAVGSTVSYLERYTLLAATGLAAAGMDNDGGQKYADLDEQMEFLANCRDEQELNRVFTAAFKDAKAVKDAKACLALVEARDKKRGEFRANR